MSGMIGGKGSNSSLITSIGDKDSTSGGVTLLNYLICAMADANMAEPSSTNITNFNTDNNWSGAQNPRNFLDPTDNPVSTNYNWLFGPDYSPADAANGGFRVEITFRVPVRIDQISLASVSTNARAYHFGLFVRPNGSDSDTGITFHAHQFCKIQHTGAMRGYAAMTAFGASRNLTSLSNTAIPHVIGYENVVGQTFLLSFGQSIHNNGNQNAGLGSIVFYGQALTN